MIHASDWITRGEASRPEWAQVWEAFSKGFVRLDHLPHSVVSRSTQLSLRNLLSVINSTWWCVRIAPIGRLRYRQWQCRVPQTNTLRSINSSNSRPIVAIASHFVRPLSIVSTCKHQLASAQQLWLQCPLRGIPVLDARRRPYSSLTSLNSYSSALKCAFLSHYSKQQ